jgi:hypothetical protein
MLEKLRKLKAYILRPPFFYFEGDTFAYFDHPYNHTIKNERAIEIPIVKRYYDQVAPQEILEVGNVLSHYFPTKHQVLDKYEQQPGVINQDASSYRSRKKYALIISISTFEHIGWDEYPRDPQKIATTIANLFSLLKKGGRLIFTVPLGYNHDLDTLIRADQIGFTHQFFMKRLTSNNKWQQQNATIIKGAKYNYPFPNANELMIGILVAS